MSKRTFRIGEGEPLLDVVSYGRGGPSESGGRLTLAQVEQIRRTAQRRPECRRAGESGLFVAHDGAMVESVAGACGS
jgi:hypothetical protein